MDKGKRDGLLRVLRTAMAAVLIAMGLFSDFGAERARDVLGMGGLEGAAAAAGAYAILSLIRKYMPGDGRPSKSSVVSAAFFALTVVVCKSFDAADGFQPITASFSRLFCAVIVFAGCFLIFERVMAFLLARIEAGPGRETNLFRRLFPDDAGTLRIAAIILVFWLPLIIATYPGSHSGDMHDQLAQYMGYNCRTARICAPIDANVYLNAMNPVAHTVLMGFIITLFRDGGDITRGLFLFNFLQSVAAALVFARTFKTMRRCGLSRSFRLGALAYFCLNPFVPLYAFSTAKDTPFALLLLLIATLLADAFIEPEKKLASPLWFAGMVASTLMFILLRNSAIFIAVVTVPAAYFAIAGVRRVRGLKPKAALAGALVLPILLSLVVTNIVYPDFAIRKGTARENKSLMFQQTARYALTHPDEVTEAEKAAISNVLAYDEFAERYLTWEADPIKMTYNEKATPEELRAYERVWRAQFLKHPETYVEAAINMCYAYFYIGMDVADYKPFYYRAEGDEFVFDGNPYVIVQPRVSVLATTLVKGAMLALSRAPGTGIPFQLGTYAWILIAMAFVCLKERTRAGLLLIPFLALLLGVGFTAVNGAVRYALGIIYALPLIAAIGVAGARGLKRADVATNI